MQNSSLNDIEEAPAFAQLVALLAIYSDAANRMEELQAEANRDLMELLDDKKDDYAELQAAMTKAELGLQQIALAHPQWFFKRRSLKTPYGTVKMHHSTKLHIPDEEASLLLVQNELERLKCDALSADPEIRDSALQSLQELNARDLVRRKESLNLEALERLSDATLRRFRIERCKDESFSVVPARLDLGKATAAALEQKAA